MVDLLLNITPVINETRAGNTKLNAAIADGDAIAIAALYTEDAKLLPDGAPRIDGRAAIESFSRKPSIRASRIST